jgi:hypothetical protein
MAAEDQTKRERRATAAESGEGSPDEANGGRESVVGERMSRSATTGKKGTQGECEKRERSQYGFRVVD